MIGTIDVEINAAHPAMPLAEFAAFVNSPSHVRVRNVPRGVGNWQITAVHVAVTYPDNSARTVSCAHVGALWTCTISGCDTPGHISPGYQVLADGTDEDGNAITGYVLGAGDVTVVSRDATIRVDGKVYYLHLLDSLPETPNIGDMCEIDGAYKFWNGTRWVSFGGGGGDMSHADFAELAQIADLVPDDVGLPEVCQLMNTIKNLLKPSAALLALALPFLVFATAAEVEVNKLSNLKGGSNVVTRVNLSGFAKTNSLPAIAAATASNVVTKAYVESLGISSTVRVYDQARHCWWRLTIDDGIQTWTVED